MPERFITEAMARAEAAIAVVEKHKGELLPHILMILRAIGPDHTRACVAGAVEAAIIAAARAPSSETGTPS